MIYFTFKRFSTDSIWNMGDYNKDNSQNFVFLKKCDEAAKNEETALQSMGSTFDETISRLMYLFLADFIGGVDISILHNKDIRDRNYLVSTANNGVPNYGVLLTLIGLDMSMIGYTVLFALNASTESQYAWCKTFAVCLLVETVFVNTMVTVWTHVWIPSFSYAAIQRIKSAVIKHLVPTSPIDRGDVSFTFNASKHFFVSHRLAALLTEVDSDVKTAVLHFSTPWPLEQFVTRGVVPHGSEAFGLWYHLVRCCISMHPFVHDLVITTVFSVLTGIATVILGSFYESNSTVTIAVVGILVCVVLCLLLAGAYIFDETFRHNEREIEWNSENRTDFYYDDAGAGTDGTVAAIDPINDDFSFVLGGIDSVASDDPFYFKSTATGEAGEMECDDECSSSYDMNDTVRNSNVSQQHIIDINNDNKYSPLRSPQDIQDSGKSAQELLWADSKHLVPIPMKCIFAEQDMLSNLMSSSSSSDDNPQGSSLIITSPCFGIEDESDDIPKTSNSDTDSSEDEDFKDEGESNITREDRRVIVRRSSGVEFSV